MSNLSIDRRDHVDIILYKKGPPVGRRQTGPRGHRWAGGLEPPTPEEARCQFISTKTNFLDRAIDLATDCMRYPRDPRLAKFLDDNHPIMRFNKLYTRAERVG